MHRLKLLFLILFAPVVLAACGSGAAQPPSQATSPPAQPTTSEPIVAIATDAKLGAFLTDAKGMTLYMFTNDEPNVSNCYEQCAQNWPPLIVTSGEPVAPAGLEGTLGTTVRKDGSRQVTYNGMPLYYWISDKQPGDTTGQGVGDVWFVVAPGAAGFPTVKVTNDPSLGPILTDHKGMTLYLFTNDQPSLSNCYDRCAENWPPLIVGATDPVLAGGVAGQLGVTPRKDGSKQATYNGMPLYYWINDKQPGDTTGQGVGDVWFVVPPATPSAESGGDDYYS